jgi:hypothetical protein
MVGLNEEGFMCNPFAYNVARDGSFTQRVAFHNVETSDERKVVFPPSVCEATHHDAFKRWLSSRHEKIIGAGIGLAKSKSDILYIDYVCSNAYENNLYFACIAGENKRPAKEMYQYATECRNLCETVYRFACHAYILIYQKDDTVWCYRVRE